MGVETKSTNCLPAKADETVREIMAVVTKSKDGAKYNPNLEKAGSFPTKTKISNANEFDNIVTCKTIPMDVKTRGYVSFKYKQVDKKVRQV
jgi:hypothetical protein